MIQKSCANSSRISCPNHQMMNSFDAEKDMVNRTLLVGHAKREQEEEEQDELQTGLTNPTVDADWMQSLIASRRAAVAYARAMYAECIARATDLELKEMGVQQCIRWHTPRDRANPVHTLSHDAFVAYALKHSDLMKEKKRTKNQAATMKDLAEEPIRVSFEAINAYLHSKELPLLSAAQHLEVLEICLSLMHDKHFYCYSWHSIAEVIEMPAEEREDYFSYLY